LGIAAFIVMHDTTLEDLCLKRPSSMREIREVSGFGERKTELYGREILEALKQFREESAESQHVPKKLGAYERSAAVPDKKIEPKPRTKSGAWWGAR
jgi:ATP-dependent DNA helicase RecQ